jgi:DNA mismatch repair protein MutS
MVEMTETANIMHNASENSLVLMDEIGRGTSTYDGLSLAWASAHYLSTKINALTLFATHYFELTEFADQQAGVVNIHLDAHEHGDDIVFMHSVHDGAASKSFGIQVAKLAGLPSEVLSFAKSKLQQLELTTVPSSSPQTVNAASPEIPSQQLSLVNTGQSDVMNIINNTELDELSPRQAWQLLSELKSKLKS